MAARKRDSQRRRRNKDVVETDHPVADGARRGPEFDIAHFEGEEIHPLALNWYEALRESGQSVYFEPSDWAQAQILMEQLSRMLRWRGAISATGMQTWLSGAGELLTTEGVRRRVRIEVEKEKPRDLDEEAAVAQMDQYRQRFKA